MTQRPIAKKYCEGKLKRTPKGESKEPEIVQREQNGGGIWCGGIYPLILLWREEGCRSKMGIGGEFVPCY